jgi:hypothetical protein
LTSWVMAVGGNPDPSNFLASRQKRARVTEFARFAGFSLVRGSSVQWQQEKLQE